MNDYLSGFTIKVVAERTGISVYTLRAWERRYGVPRPNRHENNGYRLYDEHDIADVLWMKRQVETGLSPAQASLLFQQKLPAQSFTAVQSPIADTQAALQRAFLESNERTAQQILDQAFTMFAPEQVTLGVIQPTMTTIGEYWLQNKITVWQEHLASNLVRRKLYAVMQSQATSSSVGPRVLAACAPAEDHEIGLLIFALLAQQNGWNITYLGQRTPITEITNAAREAKPAWTVISVTTVIGLTSLLPWLLKENRPAVPLAFGGRLLNLLPKLQERIPGTWLGDDLAVSARGLALLKPRREMYVPRRRVWDAVTALQEHRLTIAGQAAEGLLSQVPMAYRARVRVEDLHMAGLYLADSLSSALAFDLPELIDLDRRWLNQVLSPRAVPTEAVQNHVRIFSQTLNQVLRAEYAQAFKPLFAQLSELAAR